MNRCNNSLFSPNIYFWHERCLLATIFYAHFSKLFNSFLILHWPPSPHCTLVSSTIAQLASSYPINPQYMRVFRPTVNIYVLHVCVSSYGRSVALLVDCRHYRWFLTAEGHPIHSMWLIRYNNITFNPNLQNIGKGRLKLTVYYKI